MDSFSISFTLGKGNAPHGGNIRHNNRDYYADNVQKNNTALNVEYKRQDIEEAFHELFDEALKEYNDKQTRKDRVIEDYYSHLKKSRRESHFYEAIIQFGNVEDTPCGSERGEIAKQMLDEYMKEFQKRNPNLLFSMQCFTWTKPVPIFISTSFRTTQKEETTDCKKGFR